MWIYTERQEENTELRELLGVELVSLVSHKQTLRCKHDADDLVKQCTAMDSDKTRQMGHMKKPSGNYCVTEHKEF